MAKVFISYRRDDARYPAKELFRALSPYVRNPKADIFLDIDSIPRGLDFVEFLDGKVAQCEILLALIGDGWIDARDASGARRLDNPEDFVRIEIAAALTRGIPVVPVLLDGAQLPLAEALPDPLKPLVRRQAEEVRLHTFDADVSRLVKGLPVSLKGVAAPTPKPASSNRPTRTPLFAGLAALALIAVAASVYTIDPFRWFGDRPAQLAEVAEALIPVSPQGEDPEPTEAAGPGFYADRGASSEMTTGNVEAEDSATRQATIRELQTALKALGHYTSSVDGSAGVGTQRAAEDFARSQDISAPQLANMGLAELKAFSARAAGAAKIKRDAAVRTSEISPAEKQEVETYDKPSSPPGESYTSRAWDAYMRNDYTAAFRDFQTACTLYDDMSACINLGVHYQDGRGVRQSDSLARFYYGKACDAGYESGCSNLRNMDRYGSGSGD